MKKHALSRHAILLEDRIAAATLIADLNTTVDLLGSSPRDFTVIGGTTYFTASHPVSGRELWKTDGTAAGTVLLKDLRPGRDSSDPAGLFNFNGTLYFSANDGETGTELWKSDGTAAGTVLVRDLRPGQSFGADSAPYSSNPGQFTKNGSVLYFTANDGASGIELWKSDGTEAGTVLVKDIFTGTTPYYGVPLPNDSAPQRLTVVNGTLFFSAYTIAGGRELWKSDGTEAGTVLVKDILPGTEGGYPRSAEPTSLFAFNNTLFFTAKDSANGFELWTSDGTETGTTLVEDIDPGTNDSAPSGFTNVNGVLFFVATTAASGRELWTTDGTAAGTALFLDVNPGVRGSSPSSLHPLGTSLYFEATTVTGGSELWKSNGTPGGTSQLKDIRTGVLSSNPTGIMNVGSTIYFLADNGTNGREVWVSNGTAAGTNLLKDINPSTSGSSPTGLTPFGTSLLFTATGSEGAELWTSNGTAAGTLLVKDIAFSTKSSAPQNFIEMGGLVYFTATDGTAGNELWKSDGTAAGTAMVKDLRPGGSGSYPTALTIVNGVLYFAANDGSTGIELWRSDGTAIGTTLVRNIRAGASSSEPKSLVAFNNQLYFTANDGVTGRELWKSDGTPTGTVVLDLRNGSVGSDAANLGVANGTLFLSVKDDRGSELWKSDGTRSGTVFIKDLLPGSQVFYGYPYPKSSSPADFFEFNGKTLFVAGSTSGVELWQTDGTSAGTVLVKDIATGAAFDPLFGAVTANSSYPAGFTNVNGTVYFRAKSTTAGAELWKTDGTTFGTVMVRDIFPGRTQYITDPGQYINGPPESSYPTSLTNVNGALIFVANDNNPRQPLWTSDGTADGTVPLPEGILPDAPGLNATIAKRLGDRLLLTLTTNLGQELWSVSLKPDVDADDPTPERPEGSDAIVTGTFGDFEGNDPVTLTANTGTLFVDRIAGTWSWTPPGSTADGPQAPFPVTITATDPQGHSSSTTFSYTLVDVAPQSQLIADPTALANVPMTVTLGDIVDPGADTLTGYAIHWGDGNTTTGSGNPAGVSFGHTYAASGNFTISLSLTNEDGTFAATATHDLEVLRATLDTISPGPGGLQVGPVVGNSSEAANVVTLSGKADSIGLTIRIFDGDTEIGTATSVAGAGGPEWSYTTTTGLVDGSHSFRVRGGTSLSFSPAIGLIATSPVRFVPGSATAEDGLPKSLAVKSLLNPAYADPNDTATRKAPRGAAIVAVHGAGSWQYQKAGKWLAIDVADSRALLLTETNRIRYVPAPNESHAGAITYRAWDQSAGNAFDFADATRAGATGGRTDLSVGTDTAFVDVIAVNDRPTLDAVPLRGVPANLPTAPYVGATFASLLGGSIADVDSADLGVAITAVTGKGRWAYFDSSSWILLPAVSSAKAFARNLTDTIAFLPDAGFTGAATLTMKLWDKSQAATPESFLLGTTGTSFSTNAETVHALIGLSSPVTSGSPADLPNLKEDAAVNPGTTISQIVTPLTWTDADFPGTAKPKKGVAITATTGSFGQWQYQAAGKWLDVGSVSLGSALLLSDLTRVRFVPSANQNGAAGFTFVAWDQSAGTTGERVDPASPDLVAAFGSTIFTTNLTVVPVNDAPKLDLARTPVLPPIAGPTGVSTDTVANLLGLSVTDPDGLTSGIAVVGFTAANGTWSFFDGTQFVSLPKVSASSPLRLNLATQLRFTATAAGTASLSYRAWDGVAIGAETETAFVAAGGVAPAFTSPANVALATINEDTANPPAIKVSLFSPTISAAKKGIAITGTSGSGTWQYRTAATWLPVGTVSESSAILLRDLDAVRFVPSLNANGIATLTVKAWNATMGLPGDRADTTVGSAFGNTSRNGVVTIVPVNDRPTIDGSGTPTLIPTAFNTPSAWTRVSDLLAGIVIADAETPGSFGIAVTATTGTGYWEYNNGGGPRRLTASIARAKLISPTSQVRFVPTATFRGKASIAFRAWDGAQPASGDTVNAGTFTGVSLAGETAFVSVDNLAPAV
jgi:ELWxxDGT repeat protein